RRPAAGGSRDGDRARDARVRPTAAHVAEPRGRHVAGGAAAAGGMNRKNGRTEVVGDFPRRGGVSMHVAVTGASSGIGEAVARAFAKDGAKVTLVARRREVLEKIAGELPGESFVVTQDLADPAHAADWIPKAEEALGPIDVLVSN